MAELQAEPHLQSIPPELRNRVYDYALVSDGPINVAKPKNCAQPPLLATCRQIRSEAISVYYSTNSFTYTICNYKGAAVVPFCKLLAKYRADHRRDALCLDLCSHLPWPYNLQPLREWLKAYHAHRDLMPAPAQDQLATRHMFHDMATRLFGVVWNMRQRTWCETNEVLYSFLEALEDFQADDPPYDWDCWDDGDEVWIPPEHICASLQTRDNDKV